MARLSGQSAPPQVVRYNTYKRLPYREVESPARQAHQRIYAHEKSAGSPDL